MVNTFLIGSSTITGTHNVDSRKINDLLISRPYSSSVDSILQEIIALSCEKTDNEEINKTTRTESFIIFAFNLQRVLYD